ncbi:unnamed protein product [Cuscuta campestris]|uniref:Uncharacterized protein n=1 Tax=Cuscuta campestris TaxID=132261 RepID=A0A484M5I0_9ASTE|nr:unnamed protein product [Cuscuta campestris]
MVLFEHSTIHCFFLFTFFFLYFPISLCSNYFQMKIKTFLEHVEEFMAFTQYTLLLPQPQHYIMQPV